MSNSSSKDLVVPRLVSLWKRAFSRAGTRTAPQRYQNRLTLELLENRLNMDGTLPPPLPPPPPPPPPVLPPPSLNGPVANDDAAAYFFDHAAPIIGDIFANDTDPNAGATIVPRTVFIVTPPQHGIALPDPMTGQILYTPNTIPASAQDTFTYRVSDTLGLVSNTATVTLSPVGGLINNLNIDPIPTSPIPQLFSLSPSIHSSTTS